MIRVTELPELNKDNTEKIRTLAHARNVLNSGITEDELKVVLQLLSAYSNTLYGNVINYRHSPLLVEEFEKHKEVVKNIQEYALMISTIIPSKSN